MLSVVVKDKVGRRRYIIAKNDKLVRVFIREIRDRIDEKAKIVYYDDFFVIIKCRHWYKDEIIKFLQSRGINTYKTTGTIKKAKKMLSGLRGFLLQKSDL